MQKFIIPAILLLLLIGSFYDVVFQGKTFKVTTANSQALPTGAYGQANNKPKYIPVNGTDAPVSEEPIYEFIKQNLAKGILPLWNPHQACGFALIGMLEVGIFYPLNAILYLFPNTISWDMLILTRLFLAGLFTFFLMRRLGFEHLPSLGSAVTFMLSGPMVLLQYWTVNVDLLAPLLLLAFDHQIKTPNRRAIALTALTIALTFFAGHPEHVFLVNAVGTAFFIFRYWTLKPRQPIGLTLSAFLFSYVLGLSLAAMVLFPFLRNLSSEFWHGHPEGTGLLMEEQRDRAITLALPHFFQKENLTYDFTFAGWWGGYLGTLPLALAFLSLFKKQARGLNYFFAGMTFLIIGKEYGLPIINSIGYLPLFNVCRYAIHTPPLAALLVALLTGMGIQSLLKTQRLFSKGLIFLGILMALALLQLWIIKDKPYFMLSIKATLFALFLLLILQAVLYFKDHQLLSSKVLMAILVLALSSELFLYIHRERPYRFDSFPRVPYIEFLKSQPGPIRSYGIFWAFYPNTATGFEVDDLGYFLGLVPSRFVHFVNAVLLENHFKNDLRPPALRAIPIDNRSHFILDLLNIRYFIAPEENRFKRMLPNYSSISQFLTPVYQNEVTIFERPSALPRAFIVHRAVFEVNDQKSLLLLKSLGPALREGVIIHHPLVEPIAARLKDLPAEDHSTVKITHHSANTITLQADMEHAGFVVLSEAYHPDWTATIDGQKTNIFQADYLLRAVFVPEGQHHIKMTFAPSSFYGGLVVSLMALIVLAGLLFFRRTNVTKK